MKGNLVNLTVEVFRKKPVNNSDYYLVSIKRTSKQVSYASFFSIWNNKIHEGKYDERKIDLIIPKTAIKKFEEANQKVGIIDTASELTGALRLGGHFLIEGGLMQENWSEILKPKIVVSSHSQGLLEYDRIVKPYLRRYADGKVRMEVLNRDKLKCRICGKSPDDERFLKLEIHHIKPWQEGGITEPSNLITLCHLCHEGVEIVDRNILYKKIGISFPWQNHLLYEACAPLMNIISNSVVFKIEGRNTPLK